MPKLPVVSGRQLIQVLQGLGFRITRTRGSHVNMINEAGRRLTVPVHANQPIAKGTLRDIINQAGLTVERLIELLK